MPDITNTVTINAAPDKVYQALTEPAGLAAWWTAEAVAKPEAGSVSVFKFAGANRTEMQITQLIPNQRVAWVCLTADGLDEWVGTTLSFDLDPQNGATHVRFTHANWKQRTQLFTVFEEHWGGYMQSLKSYCETGKGQPFGAATAQSA